METIPRPTPGLKESVAAEVRAALARRKIPVTRLPAMIGKSQSYWDRRVGGKIPFDVEDLALIARVTEVRVLSFFSQEHSGYRSRIRPFGSRRYLRTHLTLHRQAA